MMNPDKIGEFYIRSRDFIFSDYSITIAFSLTFKLCQMF